jgi:hypothetical protein
MISTLASRKSSPVSIDTAAAGGDFERACPPEAVLPRCRAPKSEYEARMLGRRPDGQHSEWARSWTH